MNQSEESVSEAKGQNTMEDQMQKYIAEAEQDLLHTYNRYQVVLDHGDGVYLYDINGKKYLDFADKIAKTDTVVTISVNFSGLLPEWEEIAATSMAVQNMYLTCTANQIGCYWSSHTVINHLGEFLNLEENQRCLGLFYLGKI